MKTFAFYFLMVFCAAAVQAQPLEHRYDAFGKLVLFHLSTAPFPDPKRADGHVYHDKTYPMNPNYSDSSVAVFIPAGFKSDGPVDIVIHIHGWNNNVDSVFTQYRLIEQFSASRKNAILIVPQGPYNAPDSYGGKLESAGGFKRMITDILSGLHSLGLCRSTKPGTIILSGHSGAYEMISFILLRGGLTHHIKEVFLFDALYGQTEKYAYWLANQHGRLIDIYTRDGGTKNETENLMDDLKAWNIPFFVAPDSLTTARQLHENRIVFLQTDLAHNDVISARNEFRKFLEASVLKRSIR